MYLRKLTISGFKSFADKTEIEFDQGVTGVIGPNGCGKSNVSDSIRWVLGEQNPRKLRGQGMLDMIFNGTVARPAAGMAEVSLLFDNSDEFLPVSYREVLVTRRLLRNGDSEYSINKAKCRLKDITDLFLDSGIGTNAYSLMEQGRVDMIVNAKPAERRELLEEAAGVSRFLHRKNEALRKLDRTEIDLTRLQDILSELQRQRRSLERQAKQAELARKYRGELIRVEYIVHTRSGKHLHESLEKQLALLVNVKERVEALETQLRDIRQRKQVLGERLQEQSELSRKQRDVYASSAARLEQMERHLQNLNERSAEYLQLRTRLLEESELDAQRCEEEKQRIARAEEQIALLTEETNGLQQTIAALSEELDRVSKEYSLVESEEEKRRKIFLNLEQDITETKNQQRVWERDGAFYSSRLEQVEKERARVEEELEAHRIQKEELTQTGEELEMQLAEFRENLEAVSARLQELAQAETESKSALQQCERRWQQANSRWESLCELRSKLAGFDEGVRFLMRNKDEKLPQLVCTLAERIQVEAGYEIAIEAALAQKLQAIVAENDEAIIQAVGKLREQKKGRVAFLSQNAAAAPSLDLPEPVRSLKRARSLVRCEESLNGLLDRLLDCVLVVDNLDEALRLRPHLAPGMKAVSREGDVVEGDGGVTGGYSSGSQILSRAAEIAQLEAEIERLNEERKGLEIRTQEIRESLQQKTLERDGLRQTLLELENRRKVTKEELQRVDQRLQRLYQSQKAFASECEGLNENLRKGAEEAKERAVRLAEMEKQKAELQIELESWTQQIALAREHRRSLEETLADRRMTLLEKKKDLERWAADIETVTRHLKELERGIVEKKNLAEQQEKRREETLKAVEEVKTSMVALREERDAVWKEVCALEETTQCLRSEVKKIEESENVLLEQYEAVRSERESLEQERMKLQVETEYWKRKLDEVFSELEDKEECERDPRSDEEVQEKVEFYRRRLSQLGVVNELAIEEFEEVNQRCEFLETQQKDLEKSKSDLLSTAKELHGATTELFLETFQKVKENFHRIFRRMFNGGRAELILQEGDPMEAGIEIEVQPPGKKLQSLTLLSGGEKALVAVCLLFAVYEIKPCPFCFLDEIDAPLDDRNIGRFTTMLRSFLDRSQFIIITHSKKTMEMCDALYGVTMAQEGISSLYSMKFKPSNVTPLAREGKENAELTTLRAEEVAV
ncbi:MAG: chromosome segregation protein SMC [Candidatus Omnitrophota bacterium]